MKKYKVGDKVEIIRSGFGYGGCYGEIVTILEVGTYYKGIGYKTTKTVGSSNANSGQYNGFACGSSFRLVESSITYEVY